MQKAVLDPRIKRMFSADRLWAIGAVVVLWSTYLFVLYEAMPSMTANGVLIALTISGGLVLLFNTASIFAMINHYSHDKEHIYGLDLHYLDVMNQNRA